MNRYEEFISGDYIDMVDYEVLDPDLNYRGKSYSSWATDWFNYFLSIDPDKHVFGSVVFLKSVPGANQSKEGTIRTENEANESAYAGDPYYPRPYENNPNVKVGADKLQISIDQVIFWPFIMAYELAVKPYQEWGALQEYTGVVMDHGDDPPDSKDITINGKPIILPKKGDMSRFRIQTPVFTALVPEAEYGRSLRDFLEDDVLPGHWPAVVEGYFGLIKFSNPGTYLLHSLTKAGRELRGSYSAEILCEVEVSGAPRKDPSRGIPTGGKPARNEGVITRILSEKIKSGEITATEANTILKSGGYGSAF